MDIVDTILHGDALQTLRTLPGGCVQCCISSPPYFGLRDYGVPGQLGLEATPDAYVARMVEVFAEVRRVLRDDGVLWLNLGDAYANDLKWGGRSSGMNATSAAGGYQGQRLKRHTALKPKDLIGIPWLVAFALRADGWYLRSDIVWHKPNPMPESVRDRPTRSHEYLFLLAKSERYFYDADAIREDAIGADRVRADRIGGNKQQPYHSEQFVFHGSDGRNKRDVWTVATAPYSGAHFAVFPPALIEPCVLAGTSPRACETCGAPWVRVVSREVLEQKARKPYPSSTVRTHAAPLGYDGGVPKALHHTHGWRPTCRCLHNTGAGKSLVLDPFMGAGTVGVVARRHSRHYLGIELNQAYIEMANDRIAREVQPVLWTA